MTYKWTLYDEQGIAYIGADYYFKNALTKINRSEEVNVTEKLRKIRCKDM